MSTEQQGRHRYALALKVRYADTDAQGHVFFANYLTYADEGLTGYLEAIGCSYRSLGEQGLDLVYAASRCTHRGSARFGDTLQIHTAITKLGNTSVTCSVEVCRADELLAEIELVSVMVDRSTLSPRTIPDMLRQATERFESRASPGAPADAAPDLSPSSAPASSRR